MSPVSFSVSKFILSALAMRFLFGLLYTSVWLERQPVYLRNLGLAVSHSERSFSVSVPLEECVGREKIYAALRCKVKNASTTILGNASPRAASCKNGCFTNIFSA